MSNSVSLLADAGHNLGRCPWTWRLLGLRERAGQTRAADRALHLRQCAASSILAALFNAVFLLVTVGGPLVGGHPSVSDRRETRGRAKTMMAGRGDRPFSSNAVTAWLFASGRKDDINLAAGAFLPHGVRCAGICRRPSGLGL